MTWSWSSSGTSSNRPIAGDARVVDPDVEMPEPADRLAGQFSTAARSLTSVGTASACRPRPPLAGQVVQRLALRAARTTKQPRRATPAVPLPKPLDAPVMTTTLPPMLVIARHGCILFE